MLTPLSKVDYGICTTNIIIFSTTIMHHVLNIHYAECSIQHLSNAFQKNAQLNMTQSQLQK